MGDDFAERILLSSVLGTIGTLRARHQDQPLPIETEGVRSVKLNG